MTSVFVIETNSQDLPVVAVDAVITAVPARYCSVGPEGESLVDVQAVGERLREMTINAGRDGEQLHHANWVMTSDPQTVRELGLAHPCVSCQAGVDQAVAHLRDQPAGQVMVGSIYWASQP